MELKNFMVVLLGCGFLLAMSVSGGEADRKLAIELAREKDHHAAAIEFRRLALGGSREERQGGYYWLAGYQYSLEENADLSDEMLDRAESLDPDLAISGSLLRGRNALARNNADEAAFYYRSLVRSDDQQLGDYAARRLAAIQLRAGDAVSARETLEESASAEDAAFEAIEDYRQGDDKSPVVGGLLGIVPGLGHAYSEEYANGLRCLILNSLFIYGMAHTAQEEDWGAFAVISFFELTWYSGSIYGGIDSAHRYNRQRLDDCVKRIEGNAGYSPDWKMTPTIRLEFKF